MNTKEVIHKLSSSHKTTPVKVYLKSRYNLWLWFKLLSYKRLRWFRGPLVIYGEYKDVMHFMTEYETFIEDAEIEYSCRNSAVPLLDILELDARIEPGAIIREGVVIHSRVVVLMGAIINIGAEIGEESMIDMGAIIGGRAFIGRRCHVGANAVIAGVVEPPSDIACVIEDDVLIGANAVILEGVRIGRNSVIGAGTIVLHDVPPNSVVVGNPGKIIKQKDAETSEKCGIVKELRNL